MFSVPALSYDYDALGEAISAEVMRLHHDKHHQAYVDALNTAIASHTELQGLTVEQLLRGIESVPESIRQTVRNNAGGHYNHCLFWLWLSPQGGTVSGELEKALIEKYGSFEAFKELFSQKARTLFGSGWVWLQPNLEIQTTPNQDSPLMTGDAEPILGLDVWEHAYYLDYKNSRADYITAWWNVINWDVVQERYTRFKSLA